MDAEEMFGDIVDRLIHSEKCGLEYRQKIDELHQLAHKLRKENADLVAQIQESRNA